MSDVNLVLALACVLVLLSVLASKVSGRSGVPALLLFLAIGMLAGSEGIGGIEFDNAQLARSLGVVALALILYAGGLDTHLGDVRPVLGRGVLLATLGTLVAAGLVGLFVVAVTDVPLLQALLLGAVVSSTDAAAVFAVLRARNVHLPVRVRGLLEFESGSNDAMAVFLTVSLITVITEGRASPLTLIGSFVLQMGLGALLGFVLACGIVYLINRISLDHDGLYPVLSLALVLLTYSVTAIIGGSGFLAVYVAGMVMGDRAYIHKRSLIRFHDGLAWLAQIAMFLVLGLLVFPSHIVPVLGVGVAVAAFLMLVARPVSVYLTLVRSRFSLAERTLIGWVGLRGAVPIILATFPLVAGIKYGEWLFNVVFFIVLASALAQGTTISWVARRLGVEGPVYEPEPISSGEPVTRQLVEFVVPEDSPIVGRKVAGAGLPDTADVILVRRYDSYIVATGSTRLRRGDVVLVLADETGLRGLEAARQLERLPQPLSLCEPSQTGTAS